LQTTGDATDTYLQINSGASGSSTATSGIALREFTTGSYDNGFNIGYHGGDNKLYFQSSVGGVISTLLTVQRADGNVGIGSASPTQKLDVAGVIQGQSVAL